jgi:hypothetical protein
MISSIDGINDIIYKGTSERSKPMTPTRQDLLEALCQVQNHPAHQNTDILTITGCGMTDDEVRRHLEVNIEWISRWNLEEAQKPAKRNRRKAA